MCNDPRRRQTTNQRDLEFHLRSHTFPETSWRRAATCVKRQLYEGLTDRSCACSSPVIWNLHALSLTMRLRLETISVALITIRDLWNHITHRTVDGRSDFRIISDAHRSGTAQTSSIRPSILRTFCVCTKVRTYDCTNARMYECANV